MRVNLAWETLVHERARTVVAMAGIASAIVLVFMQLGLYGSVVKTATLIHDRLNYDILLASPEYVFLAKPGTFPRARLYQAASVPGVTAAVPFYVGLRLWRNPVTRLRYRILVMGANLHDRAFLLPEVELRRAALQHPDTVLIDRRTRPEFGPRDVGVVAEIEGRRVEIVGQYTLGTGFSAYGALLVSDQNFARLFGRSATDHVNLGLVRVQPGADPEAVAAALREALPGDVRVWSRRALMEQEQGYWVAQTSVGLIFGFGAVVAVIVGTIFLYQVLAIDIAHHLAGYATLKAMGFSDGSIAAIVLQKVAILAVLAYGPALLLALVLYWATREATKLPLEMSTARALDVLALALVMGTASGLLCLRKLRAADPADLF